MIIYNFHLLRSVVVPDEADSPLIIDSDRVLTFAIAVQRFQMIPGRNPQILKRTRRRQIFEFAIGDPLKRAEPPNRFTLGESFGIFIVKIPYQRWTH